MIIIIRTLLLLLLREVYIQIVLYDCANPLEIEVITWQWESQRTLKIDCSN